MKTLTRLFICLILAFCALAADAKSPKYIFLFIGDGMSVPQRMATDEFLSAKKLPPLEINKMPYSAITTTRSADSLITDSAASGTAIACGAKTLNGALGVDPDGKVLKSSAVAAKESGRKVGIITSVTLNHATPAAFYAHVKNRGQYYRVGLDLIESGFDFFGGGAINKHDDKKAEGYKGDILELAEQKGYKVLKDRASIEAAKRGDGKIIALANTKEALPYAIDDPNSMRISHILKKAIELLDNDKGFFIMTEGGKIDWMCHANDAATIIKETIDLDNAVKVAIEFAKKHPDETLIVVTGDHETGGLTLGFANTGYKQYPEILDNQKCSRSTFDSIIKKFFKKNPNATLDDLKPIIAENFGLIFDPAQKDSRMFVNESELKAMQDSLDREKIKLQKRKNAKAQFKYEKVANPLAAVVVRCLDNKAGFGWTSQAHTALPVYTTASGVGAERFRGTIDNTDIAKILKDLMSK